MPAHRSSSSSSALAQLVGADPLQPAEAPYLLAYLATIRDPRTPSGRRHPLIAIPALAAGAVLTGPRSLVTIAEWAADAPQPVRGGARRPPRGAQPLGRALRGHHPPHPGPPGRRALGSAIGAWLADRQTPNQRRRAVAVDGKTLRGARSGGRQIHLLAAMEHTTRAVLAQHQVNGAPGEVPGFAPLLPTWTWPGS